MVWCSNVLVSCGDHRSIPHSLHSFTPYTNSRSAEPKIDNESATCEHLMPAVSVQHLAQNSLEQAPPRLLTREAKRPPDSHWCASTERRMHSWIRMGIPQHPQRAVGLPNQHKRPSLQPSLVIDGQ